MPRPLLPTLALALLSGTAVAGGPTDKMAASVPTPTRTSLPPVRTAADPMAQLNWLEGRWRVQGTWEGQDVEGEHSYAPGYGGSVLFVHLRLHAPGRGEIPVFELHGALSCDSGGSGYVLVSSAAGGELRSWRAPRVPEQLLVWRSDAALTRAGAPALRWTLRRAHTGAYDSFVDDLSRATPRSVAVLSGTLLR